MKNNKDFIKHSGIQAFSEIDNQFFHETTWAVRSDDDVEERLKSYAEWLKKSLSEYIDATLEKHLHLISDSEKTD
ncbi:MAG: hypothetical protein IJ666_07430 [Ruminococcus sp.]|nr:hypothetical protein [Ruminococcus sp.]